jgi:8-oxo-dGTP diphosphatase
MTRPFACDAVIIHEDKIALVKRGREPFKGEWATPGGRIEDNETAEECLVREAKEETNLDVEIVALAGIRSDPKRDPRGIIAAFYLCRCLSPPSQIKGGDDAEKAEWFPLTALPKLCSDHPHIVEQTLQIARSRGMIK